MTFTTDTAEIAKFNKLATDWWNPNGKMKALHRINPLRVHYIKQHSDLKQKKILDVGCGGGLLSEALAHENEVTGIDMSPDLIQVAKEHAYQNNIPVHYHCTSLETFAPHHLGTFDIVTVLELLEHVPDPAALISACAQVIKPNGLIFFSTINRTLKAYLLAILTAEYILNLVPKGTHDYSQFICPAELTQWAENALFKLKDLTGMVFDLPTQTWKFSRNLSVNYLACFFRLPSAISASELSSNML